MFKLFIGMPLYSGSPEPECLQSIYQKIFYRNNTYTIEAKDFCQYRGSPNIYMQRYNLAQAFLKTDCDYFLYFDGDQVLHRPENPIEMMMLDDKDIISPLIVRRFFPHIPTATTFWRRKMFEAKNFKALTENLEDFRTYPQDKPYEVFYSCGGVVLIKRKVIEAIKNPFLPVFNEKDELLSTDYSFYAKAKLHGFKCWIEPRLMVSHIGRYEYLPTDYYSLVDSGCVRVRMVNGLAEYSMGEEV